MKCEGERTYNRVVEAQRRAQEENRSRPSSAEGEGASRPAGVAVIGQNLELRMRHTKRRRRQREIQTVVSLDTGVPFTLGAYKFSDVIIRRK